MLMYEYLIAYELFFNRIKGKQFDYLITGASQKFFNILLT